MKHILILISILLLFSPLFGQSKESDLLYILENGSRYVGEWKDGKKHGQGTYIKPEGRKYVGEWKDGERWNGTLYDKEGKILGKFIKGWFDQ